MENKQDFNEYMKYKQYRWNEREMYIAGLYGDYFTYNEMLELKNISVKKILIKYQVEHIAEIPFGKGFVEALKDFEETLNEIYLLRKNKKRN